MAQQCVNLRIPSTSPFKPNSNAKKPAKPIFFTEQLAAISAALIKLFDTDVNSHGIIIQSLSNGTAMAILAGCNGIEAMICLTAALLAYPATWKQCLWGLLLGYLAIQSLNIIRIISLFYLLQWNKQWFDWAHLYIWQGLIFLDVLIVFILWNRLGFLIFPVVLPILLWAQLNPQLLQQLIHGSVRTIKT